MTRSGYTNEDIENWDLIRWRGAVASAIRGKRGQAFLREMRDALEAMPDKRLVAEELQSADGEVCAMGAVAAKRGLDLSRIDPTEREIVAQRLGVSMALVAEIAYINDDNYAATDEERWGIVRRWIDKQIVEAQP